MGSRATGDGAGAGVEGCQGGKGERSGCQRLHTRQPWAKG